MVVIEPPRRTSPRSTLSTEPLPPPPSAPPPVSTRGQAGSVPSRPPGPRGAVAPQPGSHPRELPRAGKRPARPEHTQASGGWDPAKHQRQQHGLGGWVCSLGHPLYL